MATAENSQQASQTPYWSHKILKLFYNFFHYEREVEFCS